MIDASGYHRPERKLVKGSDGILRCAPCNDGLHDYCEPGECKCLCRTPKVARKDKATMREQLALGDFLEGSVTRE